MLWLRLTTARADISRTVGYLSITHPQSSFLISKHNVFYCSMTILSAWRHTRAHSGRKISHWLQNTVMFIYIHTYESCSLRCLTTSSVNKYRTTIDTQSELRAYDMTVEMPHPTGSYVFEGLGRNLRGNIKIGRNDGVDLSGWRQGHMKVPRLRRQWLAENNYCAVWNYFVCFILSQILI